MCPTRTVARAPAALPPRHARIARKGPTRSPASPVSAISVAGIDVSKAHLGLALSPAGPVQRFPNSPKGHRALAKALQHTLPSPPSLPSPPARILLEATGGYELPLLLHLTALGLPATRVNPRQVRDFARSTGLLAKTDTLDARLLCRFGSAINPPHRPLPSPQQQRLAALQTRRSQILSLRTAELNRLELTTDRLITRAIKAVIKTLDKQLALLEEESQDLIQEHQQLSRTYEILTSVPGVRPGPPASAPSPPPSSWATSPSSAASPAGPSPPSPAWPPSTQTPDTPAANATSAAAGPPSAAPCSWPPSPPPAATRSSAKTSPA